MEVLLSAAQTRAVEERVIAAGTTQRELMEAAGAVLAAEAAALAPDGRIVVFAGGGNNGGDGWVAARLLHDAGREVAVVSAAEPASLPPAAADAAAAARAAGVPGGVAESSVDAVLALAGTELVIDALLGTGSHGAPRGIVADLIAAIADADVLCVAADLPSGVDADTGTVAGEAIRADMTVTFIAPKPGLALQPGASYAGDVVIADIGVGADALPTEGVVESWDEGEYADLVPLPHPMANKSSRGRLLIVGGSPGMSGAVALAARGALRSGAGHVTVLTPAAVMPALECLVAEPVKRAFPVTADGGFGAVSVDAVVEAALAADAVVLGPGLGRFPGAAEALRRVLAAVDRPVLLDADALHALGDDLAALGERRAPTVLTPHAGEAARLLGTDADAVDADRIAAARALAAHGATVVLKGPATVLASGGRVVINTTGGPELATLGTGDVLAGVVGALLAQGLPPLEAAALGAFVHGDAGSEAASVLTPVCCAAGDVVEYLPEAYYRLLGPRQPFFEMEG